MSRIIFKTQKEWVDAMKKAASYSTVYRNQYPYNLLYWDGSILSADCSNFQKALMNGRNVFSLGSAGSYQKDLSNTGDCTELQLLNQCTDISADFSKLKAWEPRILYMSGHIGAYIGEEVKINNRIYNVIEWTAWDGDFGAGCIYSYVTDKGLRLNHKYGYQCMSWEKHGKATKWVNYVAPVVKKWVEGKIWRLYEGSTMLKGWQEVNGKWYYLDPNSGIMKTGWWYDPNYKGWFYLDSDGSMQTGWEKVGGKWYFLARTTTAGDTKGKMKTGWLKDKGSWYYLNPKASGNLKEGEMFTGTHIIDGKTYYFDNNGVLLNP